MLKGLLIVLSIIIGIAIFISVTFLSFSMIKDYDAKIDGKLKIYQDEFEKIKILFADNDEKLGKSVDTILVDISSLKNGMIGFGDKYDKKFKQYDSEIVNIKGYINQKIDDLSSDVDKKMLMLNLQLIEVTMKVDNLNDSFYMYSKDNDNNILYIKTELQRSNENYLEISKKYDENFADISEDVKSLQDEVDEMIQRVLDIGDLSTTNSTEITKNTDAINYMTRDFYAKYEEMTNKILTISKKQEEIQSDIEILKMPLPKEEKTKIPLTKDQLLNSD